MESVEARVDGRIGIKKGVEPPMLHGAAPGLVCSCKFGDEKRG